MMQKKHLSVIIICLVLGAFFAIVQVGISGGMISGYWTTNLFLMGINIILAASLNLINGFTGEFSLGHAGFMAVGDAMGAPTEGRSTKQILQHFGHAVCDFEKPPADSFGAGNEAGQLTDDFSCAYFIARHIVDHDGDINGNIVREAIIDWSEHAVFFDRFVGPTTLRAIRRFKGEKIDDSGGLDVVTRQAAMVALRSNISLGAVATSKPG
jgi:hypothetical protein